MRSCYCNCWCSVTATCSSLLAPRNLRAKVIYLLLLPKCPINIKFILSYLKIQDSSAFAYGVYPCTLADFTPPTCRAELLYTLSRTTAALSTHTTTITHPNNPQYPSGLDCQDCKGQHCARECRGEACGKSCVGLACAAQCTGELCGAGCIGEAW